MTYRDRPATLAWRLASAAARRAPLASDDFPSLSEEEAYEVQRVRVRSLCSDDGVRVAGYKISMTSPETQALAGASAPAYGTLTSDMILQPPATVAVSDCFEPLLELELQFVVDEELSVGAARAEIEARCSVAPGIEVPDSRFKGWFGNLSVGHIVADNAVAGRVVVGEPTRLLEVGDLRNVDGRLYRDGEEIAHGSASSVMGDPLVAVEWLTNELGTEGRALTKGMVVSSGTLCMPVPLRPGSYRAHYSELGEVGLCVRD